MADKRLVNISVESNTSGLFESYNLIPRFNALTRLVVNKLGHVQVSAFDGIK